MHKDTSSPTESRLSFIKSIASCWASKQSRTLCAILLIPVLLALTLPLANILIIYPAFTDVIVEGIEDDAKRLGAHMLPASLKHTKLSAESLSQKFFGDIYKLEHSFGLMKIKIFSSKGEVLYSTEPSDIGHLNDKPYFDDVVAKGLSFTKLIKKDTKSMEGQQLQIDVVETYVPFMNGSEFLGAFEMYYDISKRTERLNQLILYSEIAMTLLSCSLILAVLILLKKEAGHQRAQDRSDNLKEEVERITQHDLKSPLISLLNGVTYLEHFSELDNEQKSITIDMRTAINTAMDMINRSLDLYKMETNKYQYAPMEMDLLEVIQQVVTDLSGPASTSNVAILILRNGSIPQKDDTFLVKAEAPLCYSLIANLLKNGIEASSTGDKVTITLNDGEAIMLTVHNTGAVPEEIRDIFFEKYATARKATGTGIGTYSAKLMTQTMGGSIDMTTSEENGTKVSISLPILNITPENPSE